MKGVKSSHLKLLISFIYHGEVEVSTEDFKDFLAVAGELRVKGLTTNDTSGTSLRNSLIKIVMKSNKSIILSLNIQSNIQSLKSMKFSHNLTFL